MVMETDSWEQENDPSLYSYVYILINIVLELCKYNTLITYVYLQGAYDLVKEKSNPFFM
jgi:hypothetical protein